MRSRPLRRRHDFLCRGIEDSMIERLEANANILAVHLKSSLPAVLDFPKTALADPRFPA
jgi:hypothetical protein